ncbi:hypothetical protein KUCAC02_030200, partial [Chaenocephalus aceratus]
VDPPVSFNPLFPTTTSYRNHPATSSQGPYYHSSGPSSRDQTTLTLTKDLRRLLERPEPHSQIQHDPSGPAGAALSPLQLEEPTLHSYLQHCDLEMNGKVNPTAEKITGLQKGHHGVRTCPQKARRTPGPLVLPGVLFERQLRLGSAQTPCAEIPKQRSANRDGCTSR